MNKALIEEIFDNPDDYKIIKRFKRIDCYNQLNNLGSDSCKIWAENSPFDKKDILKKHRYRWNDGSNGLPKSWYKIINEEL